MAVIKDQKDEKKVPKLRFPGFDGEWEEKMLGEVSDVRDGTHDSPKYIQSGLPLVTSKNLKKDGTINLKNINLISEHDYININKRSKVDVGDILFGMIGTIGNPVIVEKSGFAIKNVALIKEQEKLINRYLYSYLKSVYIEKQFHKKNAGGTQKFIALGIIRSLKIPIPSLPEQQKIADFLTSVDDWVTTLKTQKEQLESYKKGIMQKIFSQELRFKDPTGNNFPEWEEKALGEVFERIKRKNKENNKNILTISAQQGLVNQEKYFKKSVSAKDVSGYYLLNKNEFAYNKSYSKGYPMGAIKRLTKYEKGVVSTLYICFSTKGIQHSSCFFDHYFNAGKVNLEISKIAQEGARAHGLLNMSIDDFFSKIKLTIPSLPEQQKIADFLTSIDNLISAKQDQIKKTENWKKGLMQRLFV